MNQQNWRAMIFELNDKLKKRLKEEFESARFKVSEINSRYAPIDESIRQVSAFEIGQFRMNTKKHLVERLIPSWLEYQAQDSVDQYDAYLFEYSDQETPPYEAFSFGLYGMRDYKLTIERHYFQYAEQAWGPGQGLLLEPFSFCKPFHVNVLGLEAYEELHYEDENSGVAEIQSLADATCKMILNEIFSEADDGGLLSELKIRPGGFFMYDVHDGGNVQDPFYLKN